LGKKLAFISHVIFSKLVKRQPTVRRNRWFERLIAIVAVLNLGLVLFDLSYLHWRDFYFQALPSLTQLYDPIKGIKPHRETQNYLNQVDELENSLCRLEYSRLK
jgi:hypothetical protein